MADQVQVESRLMKDVVGRCVSKGLRQKDQGGSFSFIFVSYLLVVSFSLGLGEATERSFYGGLMQHPSA